MITHAILNLPLHDVSLKTDRQVYRQIVKADIVFEMPTVTFWRQEKSANRMVASHSLILKLRIAAAMRGDARSNAGARQVWQDCFEAMTRWVATWVKRVRLATVTINHCRIEKLPGLLEEYPENGWIWWVPLPHIEDKPYTYFKLTLKVDGLHSRAASS